MSEPVNFERSCTALSEDQCPEFAQFIPPGCMAIVDAEGDLVAIVPAVLIPDVLPLLNGETIDRESPARAAFHRDHAADFATWERMLSVES